METLPSQQLGLFSLLSPVGSLSRTCPDYSTQMTMLLDAYSLDLLGQMLRLCPAQKMEGGEVRALCLDKNMGWPGASLMPNFTECPSTVKESSLLDILEDGEVPRKYYLSQLACRGILRRAEKMGRELPSILKKVLENLSLSKSDKDATGGEGIFRK